jgi:O-acetyl-ADP-ribose deacetylase (regulator of RNase III)
LLARCYQNSLAVAARNELASIAFPSISTGAYGYPRTDAALIASHAITDFLKKPTSINQVRLIFFSAEDERVFLSNHGFDDER